MAEETTPEGPWTYRVTYTDPKTGRGESFEAVPSQDMRDDDEMRRLLLKTHGSLIGVDPGTVEVVKARPANANDLNRVASTVAMANKTAVRPPVK